MAGQQGRPEGGNSAATDMPFHALTASFLKIWFLLQVLACPLTSAAGPVVDRNFADPCIAQSTLGTWFAFSTEHGNINVQVASSPDFATWTFHEGYDALPTLPPWAADRPHAEVWAPDVNRLPNDQGWIMYFAANVAEHPHKHCIGTATSANIEGPYIPDPEPLICDLHRGGNIDPNLFQDPVNQKYYLAYKVDGNAIGHGGACGNTRGKIVPTPLYLQQLSPQDLRTPIGEPVFLASNVNPKGSFEYDGPNTERPSIAFRNNTYYLVYNVQCYAELRYHIDYVSCAVGVDTHSGIDGCDWASLKAAQQATPRRTLLETNDQVSGVRLHAPGSMDMSADSRKMVFHGDVNLGWFDQGHQVGGVAVLRKRAMYAGEIDYDHDSGNLVVKKLY